MRFPISAIIQPGESFTSSIRRTLDVLGPDPEGPTGTTDWRRVTNFADNDTINRWAELTDQDPDRLQQGTYATYSVSIPPVADVMARRITIPAAARQTWLWPGTLQACRACLLERPRVWKLAWRLPWTFYCHEHQRYLETNCPACSRLLRERHNCPRGFLEPDEDWLQWPTEISRPVSQSRDLTAAAGTRVTTALNGHQVPAHDGQGVEPDTYLDTIRSLTGLLFHARRHNANGSKSFKRAVAAAPRPAHARAPLIVQATTILGLPFESAVDQVADLLDPLRPPEGLGPWIKDHSLPTELTRPLFDQVVGLRASVGRRSTTLAVADDEIPQQLWPDTWALLRAMLNASDATGRSYAAMLLIKSGHQCTWLTAASILGLHGTLGRNIARTGTRSLTASPNTFHDKLTRHVASHRTGVNYRDREHAAATRLSTPGALADLRQHLTQPHLRDLFLGERIWTLWVLGHPSLSPGLIGASKVERTRSATQRQRWAEADTERLLAWCHSHEPH